MPLISTEGEDLASQSIRIGTRGSALALRQSEQIRDALRLYRPDLEIDFEIIKTTGDKIVDVPLAKVGGKGLFVKEIEEALLDGRIDLAVHSMKDVPSELPGDLIIGAVPKREDPRDVLVSRDGSGFDTLPAGAVVGTSSLRRSAQLLAFRSDLRVENLRGNLNTRLQKVREGHYDAVILAAAGIHRMGWQDAVTEYFDPQRFIPAIGQGALGLEIREDDERIREIIAPLHDPETAVRVRAERSFLHELEGGCQVPIGGYAVVRDGMVEMAGLVAAPDGRQRFHAVRRAPAEEAERLGRDLARELLAAGAEEILRNIYRADS